jgi:hypothetical protein
VKPITGKRGVSREVEVPTKAQRIKKGGWWGLGVGEEEKDEEEVVDQ